MLRYEKGVYFPVTPADYEPPGFRAAHPEGFRFDDETTNIRVGDVSTVSLLPVVVLFHINFGRFNI